ncbi:hypothetical protein I546_2995 [Mycobacterium kansasii 732]|nr:hypothetical protein I546_2995 [Mycobacterium kansasii 732]
MATCSQAVAVALIHARYGAAAEAIDIDAGPAHDCAVTLDTTDS